MPGPQPARILVADDEPAILKLVEKILSLEGHRTVSCPDGATVLARALKGNFDLLLIDYHMPGLTGFETVKKLRAAKHKLPAILMSGNLPDEIARKSRELERLELLPKPFTLAALRAAMTRSLRPVR